MSALNSCIVEFHAITYSTLLMLMPMSASRPRASHVRRHLDAALPQDYTVVTAASNDRIVLRGKG
jgi:hypothetical protein